MPPETMLEKVCRSLDILIALGQPMRGCSLRLSIDQPIG